MAEIVDVKARKKRDKSDRATVDGVLDKRTRVVLGRLTNESKELNSKPAFITSLHGVVSTGKEANVYHGIYAHHAAPAAAPDNAEEMQVKEEDRAVKIFKTRILSFKDRERYIEGERRFEKAGSRHGYKMVKLWAQKEFRNLQRLHRAGIPCPAPLVQKNHVIVMGFLGEDGLAYPRLAQAELDDDDRDAQWTRIFVTAIAYMRRMFRMCRLVHGDLSEYNMLYDRKAGTLYFIDVSQSVEQDHPNAFAFLRNDIKNIAVFFERQGADVLPDKMLYTFITGEDGSVELDAMREDINKLYKDRPQTSKEELDVENKIFRSQHMPKSLKELLEDTTMDPNDPLIRHLIGGVQSVDLDDNDSDDDIDEDEEIPNGGAALNGALNGRAEGSDDGSGSIGDSDSDADVDEDPFAPKPPRGHRFEDKDAKAQRKKETKEAQREKRETKMPKKVKKKLVAATSSKHRNRK